MTCNSKKMPMAPAKMKKDRAMKKKMKKEMK